MVDKKEVIFAGTLLLVILLSSAFITLARQFKGEAQAAQEAQRINQYCLGDDKKLCYEKELAKAVKDTDIVFAEKILNALQEFDPDTRRCHGLAHKTANAAVLQNPSNWRELLNMVNSNTCGGGFLHGILEAHTSDDPDFVITPGFIEETCFSQSPERHSQCVHAFGHLALLQTKGDVPQALKICDGLDHDMSSNCFNGLFMEDSFKENLLEHGFVAKAVDPTRDQKRLEEVISRCLLYEGPASLGCWSDLGPIFAEFYRHDHLPVYNSCKKAPSEKEQRSCYFRAIAQMVISPTYSDARKLKEVCSPLKDTVYEQCLIYLAASLTYTSPKFVDRGLGFCSGVAPIYRGNCLKGLASSLHINLSLKAEREHFCQKVSAKVKEFCLYQELDSSLVIPFVIP